MVAEIWAYGIVDQLVALTTGLHSTITNTLYRHIIINNRAPFYNYKHKNENMQKQSTPFLSLF